MKILMNFTDYNHTPERKEQNTYGGVGYYRIIKPSQNMKDHEVKVVGKDLIDGDSSFERLWKRVFTEYDIFWAAHFLNEANASAQAFMSRKFGKHLVYDVDDNYLDVPESNLQYDKFKPGKRQRAILSATLSFATALTVSTEPLKERLHAHIKHVHKIDMPIFVIPNMNDIKDWDFPKAELPTDRITIGYSGSNSHFDDLRMFFPVLAKLMKKYKNLHFEFIGSIPKDKIPDYLRGAGFDDDCLNRMYGKPATPTFKEYPEYLSQQPWHIGIAPLVDTNFTRSKSHIKWLEYSVYEIPCVASRVYPYFMELDGRETMIDGHNGFLASTPQEWEEKLEKLILDADLRNRIGKQAKADVIKNWQYRDFSEVATEIAKLPVPTLDS